MVLMIKRVILWLFVIGIVGFGLIQLVPYGRDHTNPPVVSEPNWDSPATANLVTAACADCHSNKAVWPWYSNIAPMSWLIQRDVDEGRRKMNFSTGNVDAAADEAAEKISSNQMPPIQYQIAHPEARLTDVQKAALIAGLLATFGSSGGGD
ncbi:MAG: heme-binding domain-containing protein [Chloroflexi bacterium]|nr:heme-binding domain-containing protein [Chloroflexota bacterium]